MAGEAAVGKTSLIRRFVLDEYDDKYTATLGTKVMKKQVSMRDPQTGFAADVHLLLWDVMGTRTLRELLKEAYYHGAQGILAVADLTRPDTLDELDGWSSSIRSTAGDVPTYVVVNKTDLQEERALADDRIRAFCGQRGWSWSYTSAKTGEGVEDAYQALVGKVLETRS